jgi:hypothetical protein
MRRRDLLVASGSVAAAAATGFVIYRRLNPDAFLSAGDAGDALRDLAKDTGRDAFQVVSLYDIGSIQAEVLLADGAVQEYAYDGGDWKKEIRHDRSAATSPASVTVADLPLGRLPAYVRAAPGVETINVRVDYLGRIQVTAFVQGKLDGLKVDGSGLVPDLDVSDPAAVRAALTEILDGYAINATMIGSYRDGIFVNGNVSGCTAGVRVSRDPRQAASASIVRETPFEANRLFDPRDFNPTMAVGRAKTVAAEAAVPGKVWDWAYQRPPQGGDPLVSFLIGPTGPSTRVWLDKTGKVSAVVPE